MKDLSDNLENGTVCQSQEVANSRDIELQEDHREGEEEALHIRDIDLRENSKDRIIFRKVPFPLWSVGSLIFVGACYLAFTVGFGKFGVP